MGAQMLAVCLGSLLCQSRAALAAVECAAGSQATCISDVGPRNGGAMIQKPVHHAEQVPPASLASAGVTTPLKAKLEGLQADIEALTARVKTLQGLVGMKAPEPVALQAGTKVGQFPQFHVAESLDELKGFMPVDADHNKRKGLPGTKYVEHDHKHRNIDDVVKKIKKEFPAFIEADEDGDDNTLKGIVEALEVKVQDLNSKVLDLGNMVLGATWTDPIAAKLAAGNGTKTSLASRAEVIDMEVASLRTHVASLEQAVTGTQTVHAALCLAALLCL